MCRIFLLAVSILYLILSDGPLGAQTTGYTDTFDGPLKLQDQPYFSYYQENGILTVDVNIPGGIKWQGFVYDIQDTVDLSGAPFMNLRIKSDFSFLLTAYLYDTSGNSATLNIKIQESATFVDYFLNYENKTGIDPTHIVRLQFTPNGNTTDSVTGHILFDELKLGGDAHPIAGIGGMTEQTFFVNSFQNHLEILDLKNASGATVSGGTSAAINRIVSEIANAHAMISFDCAADFTGRDTLLVTATGTEGFMDNTVRVPLLIESNFYPTINDIDDMSVMVGDTTHVRITGITDGNASVEQPLMLTVHSDNQDALPDTNLILQYETYATVAELTLIPLQAAEDILVALTLTDGFGSNDTNQTSFFIDSYLEFNHPPMIDAIPDQFTYMDYGMQTIQLNGISDGDDGSQTLNLSVESSNETVLAEEDISIGYIPGSATAEFTYTPSAIGRTDITLTLADNGGTAFNNGDASTRVSFIIESASLPPSGEEVPMWDFGKANVSVLESPGDWQVESYSTNQKATLGSFQGRDNVLKIQLINKTCWTGTWYQSVELDLDEHRYMCYDIYFEGSAFVNGGRTHSYLWDVDGNRNLPRAHEERKFAWTGEWQTVFMDFRGTGGMSTEEGTQINVHRINRILLNYASSYAFPFPVDNGTVYISNIKIGSAVPNSLIPELVPTCTIDPVPDQTILANSGIQKIQLTGITAGEGSAEIPSVTVVSDNESFIPHPAVCTVSEQGTAEFTYQPASGTGKAILTITVTATGSNTRTRKVDITAVDSDVSSSIRIRLHPDTRYQTMHGFGTFQFSDRQNYIDFYTGDLGASAVRIGLISNQVEPVNDNSDPDVLNLEAFNYGAFDFDYYRQLRDRGVETFILTSWSPPAWMKRNLSESYGYAEAPFYQATDNVLEPYYFDEFAESMVAAVRMFRDEAGIDLYAIGPQNEPAFNEPYPSAVLSPEAFAEVVTGIGDKFQREGLDTKIYMPEQVFSQGHYSMSEYISAIKADADANRYTDIIATHSYAEDGIGVGNPTYPGWSEMWNASSQGDYPKELWMTETYPEYQNWSSAFSLAGAIHGALVYGNVSLWTLWNIEGTLMNKGRPTASFYTSKNYYKFVRPGAVRICVTEDNADLLASSFIDQKNGLLTTVLINKSSEPMKISVHGDSIPPEYDMYLTAEFINFEYRGTFAAAGLVVLPANSVVTLVGSIKGDLVSPIDEDPTPTGFQLYQNYPNPFNPETTIRFSLAKPVELKIVIYNVLGQKVLTLADGVFPAGMQQVVWKGRNEAGKQVASGLYFYKITAEEFIRTKKCLLIR